jgi:hypothetical protein
MIPLTVVSGVALLYPAAAQKLTANRSWVSMIHIKEWGAEQHGAAPLKRTTHRSRALKKLRHDLKKGN